MVASRRSTASKPAADKVAEPVEVSQEADAVVVDAKPETDAEPEPDTEPETDTEPEPDTEPETGSDRKKALVTAFMYVQYGTDTNNARKGDVIEVSGEELQRGVALGVLSEV